MIGKIIIGKSFSGCIKYCLNEKLPAGGSFCTKIAELKYFATTRFLVISES